MQFNQYWLLIPYIILKVNHDRYTLNVEQSIFQTLCYTLTRTRIPTDFHYVESSNGPYAKEVKDAITVLSNADLLSEHKLGGIVEIITAPSFVLPQNMFTDEEISCADNVVDLLSRIKSAAHAEIISIVLFSYDSIAQKEHPTEQQVYDHVMNWMPHWNTAKNVEVQTIIGDLSSLGWIVPRQDAGLLDDDVLY